VHLLEKIKKRIPCLKKRRQRTLNETSMQDSHTAKYRVRINYRRILQNHILTNSEQKYMMLLPFERGMFAVS